ncbi:hypothetical protein C7459_11640 [Tumebacillus permanentifrigoris]|uniref:Uncharacterized protein n=1 Tax=Tumebacillus permanentifrigoris TaxID=378543 RepID=A0A316D948_9BACL|nr:hypothetical protein C7459_11640 [Tumebacillus permanentifrigoris]
MDLILSTMRGYYQNPACLYVAEISIFSTIQMTQS